MLALTELIWGVLRMRAKLKAVCLGVLILLLILTMNRLAQADEVPVSGLTGSEAVVTDHNGTVIKDTSTLSKWEAYTVSYQWSIRNGQPISAGDTAQVELPNGAVAEHDLSFDLKDDSGQVVGTFTIKAGETTGTIMFNDYLAGVGTHRYGTLTFFAKGTVDQGSHSGWVINKNGWVGDYSDGRPSKLVWNIAFNPDNKDLGTVVVEDTLSTNQTYLPGTLVAKTGHYDAAGNFTSTGTTTPQVAVNGSHLTFTFSNIQTAVDMTYMTELTNVSSGANAWENSATLDGTTVGGKVSWGGSGTGTGGGTQADAKGSVRLTKSDQATGAALAGAHYKLENSQGQVVKADLVTDDKGQLQVNDLAAGEYRFVETQAPAGYELNKTVINFTIDAANLTQTVAVSQADTKLPVVLGSVELTKTAADNGQALAGAVYELCNAAGNISQKNLTTNEHGQLLIKDLAVGSYQLIETKAPTGYELNSTPVAFEITANAATQVVMVKQSDSSTPVAPVVLGAVTLTKVAANDGAALAGAVYDLRNAEDQVIKSGLTTDAQGQLTVTELPAGAYHFVETKAPTGYELNTKPIQFTIVAQQTTTVSVNASDQLIPGEPEKPTEPSVPGEPERPVEPSVPGKPEKPVEPNVPGEPEKPIEPNVPGKPEKPVKPTISGKPTKPATPTKPVVPTQPATSVPSIKPSQVPSSNTTGSTTVHQPATGLQSNTNRPVTTPSTSSAATLPQTSERPSALALIAGILGWLGLVCLAAWVVWWREL